MCNYFVDMFKVTGLQYCSGSSQRVIVKQTHNFGTLGELGKLDILKKEYTKRSHQTDINRVEKIATKIFKNYENQFNWFSKLLYKIAKLFHIPTEYTRIENTYRGIIGYN